MDDGQRGKKKHSVGEREKDVRKLVHTRMQCTVKMPLSSVRFTVNR